MINKRGQNPASREAIASWAPNRLSTGSGSARSAFAAAGNVKFMNFYPFNDARDDFSATCSSSW